MKKTLLITIALVFVSTFAFSLEFKPTLLKIKGQDQIIYEFGGKSLEIPFNVGGTPASMFLAITTKGKDASIVGVKNGYLGWHYVNKIDTTVYLSSRFTKQTGDTSIIWDGKDENGKVPEAGSYYYYLWGFNNLSARYEACHFLGIYGMWDGKSTHYFDYDANGMPYEQPIIWSSWIWWQYNYANSTDAVQADLLNPKRFLPIGTCFQWKLGGDPNDFSLLQTTFVPGYTDPSVIKGQANRDGKDPRYFMYGVDDMMNQISTLEKYEWVTDGEAKKVDGWGGWDNFTWTNPILTSIWSITTTEYSDNQYIFPALTCTEAPGAGQDSPLIAVNSEGDQVLFKKDMPGWYFPDHLDDAGNSKPYSSVPMYRDWSRVSKNHWVLVAGGWNLPGRGMCVVQFANFSRILVDQEDNTDFVVWENSNGDYYLDTNSLVDSTRPWECWGEPDVGSGVTQSYSSAVSEVALDRYNFVFASITSAAMREIAMLLPDGTGCGEIMKFSDSVSSMLTHKAAKYIMSGGKYDGIYTQGISDVDTDQIFRAGQSWFVGADTFRGVITNEPGMAVEEDALTAFSVAQNMPNPFNPTTTINFTIPKAGNVTVDVYNVAGQKVATLANGSMNAGTHSIVWDASGHSAGVYFYTVKAGDFSKTMKMALVK